MPESLEQLDLLLLTVAKTRKIQPDGVRFQGMRYIDPTLAAYVGETVLLRYDPRDMAEVRLFHQGKFLCRAICPELAGQTVALARYSSRTGSTAARSQSRRCENAGQPSNSLLDLRRGRAIGTARRSVRRRRRHRASARRASSDIGMNEPGPFLVTTEYRRFAEFCDACREYRYIGLCYGPPGVGKTLSARHYTGWDRFEAFPSPWHADEAALAAFAAADAILYTPEIVNSPSGVRHDISRLCTTYAPRFMANPSVVRRTAETVADKLAEDQRRFEELLVVDWMRSPAHRHSDRSRSRQ